MAENRKMQCYTIEWH